MVRKWDLGATRRALFDLVPEVVVLVWADAALPALLAVLLSLDDLLGLGPDGGLAGLQFGWLVGLALVLVVWFGDASSVGGVGLGRGVCVLGLAAFDDLAYAVS